jgi:hypothetical protein
MLKGYVHVDENEAVFVDYVEVVEKKDIIQPYDEYIGYMEVDTDLYLVFKSVDGNYIAHKDYDIY